VVHFVIDAVPLKNGANTLILQNITACADTYLMKYPSELGARLAE